MIDESQCKINKTQREYAIFRMFAGGAPIIDVIDIVRKLLIADKEDFTEEEIKEEVERCHSLHLQEGDQSPRKIKAEVMGWLESIKSIKSDTGLIRVLIRECYGDLGFKTPNEKAMCRMAFKRLVEKGILEQVSNQAGVYRYMNGHLDVLDFMNADTTPFDIKFPFNIHEYVSIYQKSLIVLAGEPNAGKTAYLLNVARKNMDSHKINYFSSEMGAAELQIRLKKFNMPLADWQKVRFVAKSGDFKDSLDPNGLNIIDYLEVAKDFYEIGGMLTDIFNTLNKGVAVVGLQKPAGRDTGVGGARTLDKARLYMAIEPGILKIVKAKLWRQDCVNPNGMWTKWTLGGGANFKLMPDPVTGDDWRRQ